MRRIAKVGLFALLGIALLIPGALVIDDLRDDRDPLVEAERERNAIARAAFMRQTLAGMETSPEAIRERRARSAAASSALAEPVALGALAATIAPGAQSATSAARLSLRGGGGAAALAKAVRRAGEVAPILGVSGATLTSDRWTLDLVPLPPLDPAVTAKRAPQGTAFLAGSPLPTPLIWDTGLAVPSVAAYYRVRTEENRAMALDDARRIDIEVTAITRAAEAAGRARRSREVVELLVSGPRPAIAAGQIRFDATCESAQLELEAASGRSAESLGAVLGAAGAFASFDRDSGPDASIEILLR